MSNLIKSLPPFLQEIEEYKKICSTEDIEIEKVDSKINELLNEISVETAESYGLTRYEKIFNITNAVDVTTEERRFKIKSKLINQLPFNMKWLDNKLKNLVGEGNYKITLDTDNYKITVQISHVFPDIADILGDDLRKQLPANLIIIINLFQTENAKLYIGATVHVGDIQKILEVN